MKPTLTLIAALLLMLCPHPGRSQKSAPPQNGNATAQTVKYRISGRAIDASTRQPIAYATASLTADSTAQPLTAAITDDAGHFTLTIGKAGAYTLHLSFAGYTAVSRPIRVESSAAPLEVGDIELQAGITTDAVTVTAQRPIVTADIDKITYNATSDPETPTLTALEMIRKVPMLTVDGDDNIQLKGQSNFKILVNGKSSTLMAQNYKDVLKSMPANSIKSIEVITNPPAKYDAEGIGGIINIITNRSTPVGFNGSLSLGTNTWGGVNGNAYIAASMGKFSLSANYFGNYFRSPESTSSGQTENYNIEQSHYLSNNSTSKSNGQGNGFSFEAGYEIDTFNLISLSFNGYLGDYKSKSTRNDEIYDQLRVLTQSYSTLSSSEGDYGAVSGNIDYQRTFRKPDQILTASYKFDYAPNNSRFDRTITGLLNYPSYDQRSDNRARGYEHTVQIDYIDPITPKHQIETGLKYILRPNSSDPETYQRDPGGEWILQENRQNSLDYRQHIAAAYASYQLKLKAYSIKVGARAEYTINDGTFHQQDGDHPLDNKYFDLIPYVTLGWQPTQQQTLRLGYTQRLSRPGIWYLNPYVDDLDPLHISTGNPNLKSEISHNFDLTYSNFSQLFNISASLTANLTDNAIEQLTSTLESGALFSTYANIGKRQYFGLSLYGSLRLLQNKLTISLNAGTGYNKYDAGNGTGLRNEGWTHYGTLNINAQPWKNGNVYVSGGLWSGYTGLQSSGSMGGYHSIGVSHGFWDRKLILSLSASNPFQGHFTYKYKGFSPEYSQWGRSDNPYRSFRINLTWRFGKVQAQLKKARRGIQNDDVKSGGSQQQQSGGGQ